MKLNNKGFAFSTMLYGTLAIITLILYAFLSISKNSIDETYYYGTEIETKLNDCIQEEINLEKCYKENDGTGNVCDTRSYHACLGISNNENVKGTIAAEKLKAGIIDPNNGLKADPYVDGRYIYTGINSSSNVINNYIRYSNKTWRIVSIEKNGSLKLIDYSYNQIGKWDSNKGDSWETSTLKSYLNQVYYEELTNKTSVIDSRWFYSYVHSSDPEKATISYMISGQSDNSNKQNGDETIAKVGLLSIADYMKATTNSICHNKPFHESTDACNSWLSDYKGLTLDLDDDAVDSEGNKITKIYFFGDSNKVHLSDPDEDKKYYPVIYLDMDSVIIGGEGTSSNPYILQ